MGVIVNDVGEVFRASLPGTGLDYHYVPLLYFAINSVFNFCRLTKSSLAISKCLERGTLMLKFHSLVWFYMMPRVL